MVTTRPLAIARIGVPALAEITIPFQPLPNLVTTLPETGIEYLLEPKPLPARTCCFSLSVALRFSSRLFFASNWAISRFSCSSAWRVAATNFSWSAAAFAFNSSNWLWSFSSVLSIAFNVFSRSRCTFFKSCSCFFWVESCVWCPFCCPFSSSRRAFSSSWVWRKSLIKSMRTWLICS